MRKFLIFLLLSFLVNSIFATSNRVCSLKEDSTELHGSNFKQKDSLFLEVKILPVNESTANLTKNMPWIGAVLVGILTVLANIIISQQSRKSNRVVTEKQLNNSKEIALEQIESTRKNVQLEFNKTVLSGNRQAWINELRDLISKILSITMTISINNDIKQEEYQNLRYLITKVELMLNPINDKDFIRALTELEACFLDILMRNKTIGDLDVCTAKVKLLTQSTLKAEWIRVKKGE